MLVFRINLPIGVTRGSPGVVHWLYSFAADCTAIERNLYILNGLL